MLVTLTVVALVLDAVDGWVARRTGTASPLGAHFDGEVDAFLILVLSVYVARSAGAWVLAIGAARYAFLAAGWLLPWMREPLPPRYWRKVVAATQGIVLAIAAADVLPLALTQAALVVALALLAESFGRDVWWLWSHRHAAHAESRRLRRERPHRRAAPARTRANGHRRGAHDPRRRCSCGSPSSLRTSRAASRPARSCGSRSRASSSSPWPSSCPPPLGASWPGSSGRLLGLLVIVKILDMGFFATFDRPFDPVADWSYTGIGIETLRDSIGRTEREPGRRRRGGARRRPCSSSRPWRCFA